MRFHFWPCQRKQIIRMMMWGAHSSEKKNFYPHSNAREMVCLLFMALFRFRIRSKLVCIHFILMSSYAWSPQYFPWRISNVYWRKRKLHNLSLYRNDERNKNLYFPHHHPKPLGFFLCLLAFQLFPICIFAIYVVHT